MPRKSKATSAAQSGGCESHRHGDDGAGAERVGAATAPPSDVAVALTSLSVRPRQQPVILIFLAAVMRSDNSRTDFANENLEPANRGEQPSDLRPASDAIVAVGRNG